MCIHVYLCMYHMSISHSIPCFFTLNIFVRSFLYSVHIAADAFFLIAAGVRFHR